MILYTARRIHTMTDSRPTGVLVDGGTVLAVGDAADLRGQAAEVVDFGDAVLTPGLVDGHSHPVNGLELTAGVDLTPALTLDAVRTALSAARTPGQWLLGWGLNPVVFDGKPPTAADLGPALDDIPAFIVLYDGHSALASPEALRLAGIDGPRNFTSSARIVCDADGVPTGHLLEHDACEPVDAVIPRPTTDELADRLRSLLREMASVGYTGTHVMDFADPAASLMALLEKQGDLPLRLGFNPNVMPVDDGVEAVLAKQKLGGRRWRVEGVKLFVDGTVDGGTAWLEQPDVDGESTSSLWSDFGRFREAVTALHRNGVNMAVHCIGDRGVREVLGLFDDLRTEYGPLATHRIEHIETIPDEVVAKFGTGAAAASMHPLHCTRFAAADHSDSWSRRLGPERANRGFRCADLRRAGATLALGSDWPIAPHDPRMIMADAQLRRPFEQPGVPPILPGQGLTPLEALEGFTTHAAAASGEASHRGRIAPGYDADFTVFADDPLTVGPEALGTLPVIATVLEGQRLR